MLKQLALCLGLLCLANAASLSSNNPSLSDLLRSLGDADAKARKTAGGYTLPSVGPDDLINSMKKGKEFFAGLKEDVDGIVIDLMENPGKKDKDDWISIMTKMDGLMAKGVGLYGASLKDLFTTLVSLMAGTHKFDTYGKCVNLARYVKDQATALGTLEAVPGLERAIVKDMVCFDAAVSDTFSLHIKPEDIKACPPPADEMLVAVSDTMRGLFQLMTDGGKFHEATKLAKEAYSHHFTTQSPPQTQGKREMTDQFLGALRSLLKNKINARD